MSGIRYPDPDIIDLPGTINLSEPEIILAEYISVSLHQ